MADRKLSFCQLLLIEEMFKNLYFLEQKPKQFNQKRNLWELFPCLHMLLKQCEIRFFFFVGYIPMFDVFGPNFSGSKSPRKNNLSSLRLCTAAGADLLGGANGSNTHTWDDERKRQGGDHEQW